jgi:hypothetical protein
MPGDSMPLTGLVASVMPPGKVAPGRAHSTLRPGSGTLGAPHTTWVAGPSLAVITSTSVSLVDSGCGRLATTCATTTPLKPAPRSVRPSISSPPPVSARAPSSTVGVVGRSHNSSSQDHRAFMEHLVERRG